MRDARELMGVQEIDYQNLDPIVAGLAAESAMPEIMVRYRGVKAKRKQ